MHSALITQTVTLGMTLAVTMTLPADATPAPAHCWTPAPDHCWPGSGGHAGGRGLGQLREQHCERLGTGLGLSQLPEHVVPN